MTFHTLSDLRVLLIIFKVFSGGRFSFKLVVTGIVHASRLCDDSLPCDRLREW